MAYGGGKQMDTTHSAERTAPACQPLVLQFPALIQAHTSLNIQTNAPRYLCAVLHGPVPQPGDARFRARVRQVPAGPVSLLHQRCAHSHCTLCTALGYNASAQSTQQDVQGTRLVSCCAVFPTGLAWFNDFGSWKQWFPMTVDCWGQSIHLARLVGDMTQTAHATCSSSLPQSSHADICTT